MKPLQTMIFGVAVSVQLACTGETRSPAAPTRGSAPTAAIGAEADSRGPVLAQSWGPETPHFNLEVILRGERGFGLVRFRQPNDADSTVFLDVWVRDLAPNAAYRLQRAVDTAIDGTCTSTAWLTLGQGLTPFAITTEDRGTGRAALWRTVPPTPGMTFDIHFRVIEDVSAAVVLQSGCYQFTISL